MPLSVEQFIRELANSGLMSEADVSAVHESAPAEDVSANALAEELATSGRLTPFQVRSLLEGNGQRLVLGNYTVLEQIGAGGMGVVLKAQHRRMKRIVALKTLPETATDSESSIRRFHREVEAAARLSHPNIVTAHDADEAKGIHFYVMEYVDGSDLSSLVKRNGPLPVEVAVDCMLQAAQGLEYAHSEGVVHRDIKPSNLLLDGTGTVQILDMGLARIDAAEISDHTDLTGTGQIMGTIDYMAPEQALDTKSADARADIYSLGATLNYLLTGRPMLPGDTHGRKMQALLSTSDEQAASLQVHRREVSDELEQVFQRMVARDPAERFQTMGDVLAALQPLLPAHSTDSRPQPSAGGSSTQAAGSSGDSSSDSALKRFLAHQAAPTTAIQELPELDVGAETVRSAEAEATRIAPSTETVAATAPVRTGSRPPWTKLALGLLLFVGLVAAGIIVRVKTRDGVLLIEIPQAAANDVTVEVDGEQAKITGQDGKVITVEVAPGRHDKLLVTVEGVRLLTDSDSGFEVDAGGELPIVARFVADEQRPAVVNSEQSRPGQFALRFDSDGEIIVIPSLSLADSETVTLEAWVKPEPDTTETRGKLFGAYVYDLRVMKDQWHFSALTTPLELRKPGQWQNIAATTPQPIEFGRSQHVAAV